MKHFNLRETNLKYKKLCYERNLKKEWQKFLGSDYEIKVGQYISTSDKNLILKIDEEDILLGGNGILYIEYKNKENGDSYVLLENEWLVMNEEKRIHITNYIKKNFCTYYDENLEALKEIPEIDEFEDDLDEVSDYEQKKQSSKKESFKTKQYEEEQEGEEEYEEEDSISIKQEQEQEQGEDEILREVPKVKNKIYKSAFVDGYLRYIVKINLNSSCGQYAVPIDNKEIAKNFKDQGCFLASLYINNGKEEYVILDNELKKDKNKIGFYILDSSFAI
jgi:hypothetical protein